MNKDLQQTINICEAIKSLNLIALKKALKEGGNPQLRIDYSKHFTPWKWAYSCGDSAVISYLLEFGADPNTVLEEAFGQTPIFGAILGKNKDVIRVLVEGGASLEMTDDEGFTPLYTTLEQSEKCRDLIPYLLELGADMRIGIKKLDEAKKKDHNAYQSFCDKVKLFLEACDKNGNFEALEKQIPRILEVCEHFPEDLIQKAEELKEIYVSDGDDGRGQDSEDIQLDELKAGSFEPEKHHNEDKSANTAENLEESGSWEDIPSPNIHLTVHHFDHDLDLEYDVCFKKVKAPLLERMLALVVGKKHKIQKVELPNLVELQRKIMLETTEIINYSLERERYKQLLHEEEEEEEESKRAIFMEKVIGKDFSQLRNNPDYQNSQEKKQKFLEHGEKLSRELSSLCERTNAYLQICTNENKEKTLFDTWNPSISHNENKGNTSLNTSIPQTPEQKNSKRPIEILYLGRPSNFDFSRAHNELASKFDIGLFKVVRTC